MEEFPDRLKRLRTQKKLSLEAVANGIGKTGRSLISNWENGRAQPSMTDLILLSELFEVSLDELITGKTPVVEEPKPGYITVPMEEYIALQRRVIKDQQEEIERQK